MNKTALAALTLILVCNIQPAMAARPYGQLAAQGGTSLDQAVKSVKNQTGGRILSARTEGKGNQQVHVIKVLLPSGKVRIVRVNAR